MNNTSPWREYAQLRREYYQTKKRVKDDLRTVQDTEKETLKNRQKEQRNELNSRGWNGRYKELNMARSVLAVTHQGERLNLKDKLQNQRKKFYKKYQKFPSYEEWLRGKDRHQDAEQWKYRAEFSTAFVGEISGIGEEKKERYHDIRGFVPSSFERGMVTFRSKYDSSKIAFVDVGKKINVLDHDESAMLAAMQLAVQKWGSIRLDGSDAYKQKSLELAVRNGIRVTNPELQELAAILKDRNERDQRDHGGGAMYDKKLDFEKYHAAVGADFYKVTATEIHEDGTKRGFMVNKRDGALDGFSADELEEKMWRLTSLERQGRNIYYTPVSESKHHILIDDMDGESLAQMIVDGYQPAAIIESSPGNFQAVITIPKLGTDVDRAVGNAIVAKLNKEYGDPDVSGEIHAHRAPGFTNQKPKHRRKDGSFPEIKLVKTEKVECEKTQKLAEEIYKGIQALQSEEKKRLEELEKTLPVAIRGKTDIFEAYSTHLKDILRIQEKSGMDRKAIDASRVDAMISVRLRATGHKREEVEKAVEAMAPKVREQIGSTGTHIWADYAKRTTDYAFGFSGDLALKKRQQFAEHWKTLELEAKRTRNRQSRSGGDLGR